MSVPGLPVGAGVAPETSGTEMTVAEVIDGAQARILAAIGQTAPMWQALSDGNYSHIVMWAEIDQVPRIYTIGSGIVALRDDQIR